jgi:plasmid maintenance system antidote protein VapI
MRLDSAGRIKTEGRAELHKTVRAWGVSDVCRKLRVSRSYLFDLLNGRHRPSLDLAIRMWRILGIHTEKWTTEEAI